MPLTDESWRGAAFRLNLELYNAYELLREDERAWAFARAFAERGVEAIETLERAFSLYMPDVLLIGDYKYSLELLKKIAASDLPTWRNYTGWEIGRNADISAK